MVKIFLRWEKFKLLIPSNFKLEFQIYTLLKNCPNTEFFLAHIFPYSVQIPENTDQEKLHIWTFFAQW